MAKTITSMLIGIAVGQGAIHSIDQPATDFVPELKGSGYDGVTIRQLLQMRSGVDYEERYDFGEKPSVPAQIFLNAIVANKERLPTWRRVWGANGNREAISIIRRSTPRFWAGCSNARPSVRSPIS
jgi:CubicO group peptidase (beta-lactamase class C family)